MRRHCCDYAAGVWAVFRFCLVIFMAGLQYLVMDQIVAGMTSERVPALLHIIIPQMRYVFNMVIVYTLISEFNTSILFTVTRGGPADHTEVIGTYTYKIAFLENRKDMAQH